MVGRTKLWQATGSPLIQGATRKARLVWPWILLAVVLLAAAAGGIWAYLTFFAR